MSVHVALDYVNLSRNNSQASKIVTTMFFNCSAIMEFRKTHQEEFQKKHGLKLGFMSAFLKASAYALQSQPVVNAVIDDNEIVYRDYVDISVAVATPKVCGSISCFLFYNLFSLETQGLIKTSSQDRGKRRKSSSLYLRL